ncbi:SRPBCC family protein [Actinokineospora xionganensis]|uniref:Polyketide cyclase/dehydrase/lipid transport protein n=1 Tax=Actinokineospora xionganensis TaxID=2684470 RepID=A0ABR7L744_9PSEU|nr:SRPBCC family protein [Actinokineospora xionganensis]MBC6448520.1 hypothetical protein [Actinokineospora xionganensis]
MRTRFEFDVHTRATPEQVIELFTDFSANRPNRWPALSPREYRVFSVGETEAEAQEGQDLPKVSARWHYDWSTPGKVVMTVTESAYLATSSFHTVEVKPAANGGSDLHGVWDNTATNLSAKIGIGMMRVMGPTFFRRYYKRTLDRLAETA